MQGFMIALGSMSLQAGIIIVIALVLRKIFEKLHIGKKYMMLFWLIPFFCLVCPFKINGPIGFWRMSPVDVAVEGEEVRQWQESRLLQENKNPSAVQTPSKQEQEGILLSNAGTDGMQSTASVKQNTSNESQKTSSTENGQEREAGKNRVLQWLSSSPVIVWVFGGIWFCGMLVLLAGNIVRYVKLKGRLLCSIKIEKQVYIGDEIESPIVVGFFRPRIYLPSGLPEEYRTYVLEHERTHIRRGDMFFKMVAYIITCIHWFNPIVWYGFYLFGKDMEMACDEETVRRLGIKEREAYAKTLLDVAEGSALKNKIIFVAPVAFEECDVKSRIKNIMKYRKTITVLAVCAVAVCILAGGLFLAKAEPVGKDSEKEGLTYVLDSKVLWRDMVEKKWILDNIAANTPPSWEEVLLYATTADITHDGVDDLLRVVTYVEDENLSKALMSAENALKYASDGVEVKVYRGLEEGFFEKEPCHISERVDDAHVGNGTICLSRKDGQAYLLYSNPYEQQGTADYFFEAYYVDAREGVVIDNYGEVSFRADMDSERIFEERYQRTREEAVPEFRERISSYIEDAEILISLDTYTAFYSTKERKCPASEFFNTVWERKDGFY